MVAREEVLSPSRPASARDFWAEAVRGGVVALLQGSAFTGHRDGPLARSSLSTKDEDDPAGSLALIPEAGSLSATAEVAAQARGVLLQGRAGR